MSLILHFLGNNILHSNVKCLVDKAICVENVQAREGGRDNDPSSFNIIWPLEGHSLEKCCLVGVIL